MINLCEILGVKNDEVFKLGAFKQKIHKNKLFYFDEGEWRMNNLSINALSMQAIVHLKQISEDEKGFLRCLPNEYIENGYIARDKSGSISAYNTKPTTENEKFWMASEYIGLDALKKELFKCIKWEDEEPTKISDLLDEY